LYWLHKSAYSGGVDFLHHWKKRMYYVSGKTFFSRVNGSRTAIQNTQLSSERYFQRPDNYHKEYDPNRTSLTGTGGQLVVGKKSGNLVADLGVVWQSPELELNDVGFMAQTDDITQWLWMQYRVLEPKGITRRQRYNINQWHSNDFGGRSTDVGYNVNAHTQFTNYWSTGAGVTYQERTVSNADLRGGPALRYPGGMTYWGYLYSDYRKKVYAELFTEIFYGLDGFSQKNNYNLDLTIRPINAFNLTISSSFSRNMNEMQYVATADASDGPRYVVAQIDQTVARISVRMTYMITPNISVQYWGQPFGSSGTYSNFKTITQSRAESYTDRFSYVSPAHLSLNDDQYSVDADANGTPDYTFKKPDFNFGQFRSNMVMRWEYIPGSTFFLVWTQELNGSFYDNDPDHPRYSFDFKGKAHNIFLTKFTYRFRL